MKKENETIKVLKDCLNWHLGDKWRESRNKLFRSAWKTHHERIVNHIEKLKELENNEKNNTHREI